MNFLSMKYFLMLAEERSFTKAAERLHITQQTLSAHVAALERETGAKLFVRHVPLELTDSGSVFLRYARLFVRNDSPHRHCAVPGAGDAAFCHCPFPGAVSPLRHPPF